MASDTLDIECEVDLIFSGDLEIDHGRSRNLHRSVCTRKTAYLEAVEQLNRLQLVLFESKTRVPSQNGPFA